MTLDEENKLIEIASRWEWMCDLLDGKEVSDFALSFPEVQKLDDIMKDLLSGTITIRTKDLSRFKPKNIIGKEF